MEFCGGGELMERIPKHQNTFTEQQCQMIGFKILSALAYMHEQGIIHRDIKPENILFCKKDLNSEPKIIDFGMSIKLDESHQTRQISTCVGTPLYVAPEVIDGFYNDKCDVWSFGVLLFQILCGYPPFYASSKKELFNNIQTQELIFDRRFQNQISKEAKNFLKRLLCKNPFLRPTAKECLKDPWFTKHFETRSVSIFKRAKTKALSVRHVAPIDNFEDGRTIYEMLKNHRSGAKFKKEVMKVLINQMNENELEHLKRVFQKIDEDNSGTITFQELSKALLSEGSKVSQEELKQLMIAVGFENDDETDECSSNKSFKPLVIKYSDFLTACIDERRVLTKEKLLSLFKYFDHQELNYITKENIQEAFARHGKQLTEEKIDQMIYEIDPNHDQKISFEEFCQMMIDEGLCQMIDFKEGNIEQPITSPPINQVEIIQFE